MGLKSTGAHSAIREQAGTPQPFHCRPQRQPANGARACTRLRKGEAIGAASFLVEDFVPPRIEAAVEANRDGQSIM